MNNQVKPVMSDEFTFVPEKAGPEVYVPLGLLALVAIALVVANTRIAGGFDIWWVIFHVILAGGLGIMFPQIRYLEKDLKRLESEKERAREQEDREAKRCRRTGSPNSALTKVLEQQIN